MANQVNIFVQTLIVQLEFTSTVQQDFLKTEKWYLNAQLAQVLEEPLGMWLKVWLLKSQRAELVFLKSKQQGLPIVCLNLKKEKVTPCFSPHHPAPMRPQTRTLLGWPEDTKNQKSE